APAGAAAGRPGPGPAAGAATCLHPGSPAARGPGPVAGPVPAVLGSAAGRARDRTGPRPAAGEGGEMTDFGTISRGGPHAAVLFERWYACSPMELWDALTDPDRMRRWLRAEVSIQTRAGGAVRLRWEGADEMHGVITAFEPGRLLEYTWIEAALGVESL